jgi:hypothetical protein
LLHCVVLWLYRRFGGTYASVFRPSIPKTRQQVPRKSWHATKRPQDKTPTTIKQDAYCHENLESYAHLFTLYHNHHHLLLQGKLSQAVTFQRSSLQRRLGLPMSQFPAGLYFKICWVILSWTTNRTVQPSTQRTSGFLNN